MFQNNMVEISGLHNWIYLRDELIKRTQIAFKKLTAQPLRLLNASLKLLAVGVRYLKKKFSSFLEYSNH